MELNRRDFARLSLAAFSGAVAGASMSGCGGGNQPAPNPPPAAGGGTTPPAAIAATDLNACRGLNTCKNKGKSGMNECAGQGDCATTKAHLCHAENDCKYQGGCDGKAGANECKGKGGCAVPIGDKNSWEQARQSFEKRMKDASKTFGEAPAAKEG